MADTSYIETTLAQAIETLQTRRDEVTDQLRPLQDELRQIDDALMRLTGSGPTKARSASGSRRSGGTKPRGSNAEKIVSTLRESGPMRPADLIAATEISGIYAYLRKMKDSGEIKQDSDGRYLLAA